MSIGKFLFEYVELVADSAHKYDVHRYFCSFDISIQTTQNLRGASKTSVTSTLIFSIIFFYSSFVVSQKRYEYTSCIHTYSAHRYRIRPSLMFLLTIYSTCILNKFCRSQGLAVLCRGLHFRLKRLCQEMNSCLKAYNKK
jgi:hypothetical protein